MTTDMDRDTDAHTSRPNGAEGEKLTAAAERALAEAADRRRLARAEAAPTELSGRGGLDPARYGDWEVKGLASDF